MESCLMAKVKIIIVENDCSYKSYGLVVRFRQQKAQHFRLPKEQKNRECFVESYPATGGLYAYAGKGLHKHRVNNYASLNFLGRGYAVAVKVVAALNRGIWRFLGSSRQTFLTELPCHWLTERLPKKYQHYCWTYKRSLDLVRWPALEAVARGFRLGPKILGDCRPEELAALQTLFYWVGLLEPQGHPLLGLVPHLKKGAVPLDEYSGAEEYMRLMATVPPLEFLSALRQEARYKYGEYVYELQSRENWEVNSIMSSFSGGYRLLGFKFYNNPYQKAKLARYLGTAFLEGSALTTGLELEKFRQLSLLGVFPKSNALRQQLSLEQLALLLLTDSHFTFFTPNFLASQRIYV